MNRRHLIIAAGLFAVPVVLLMVVLVYPRFKRIEKRGPAPASVTANLQGDVNTAVALIGTVFNDWLDFDRPGRIGSYQNKFPHDSPWSHFFLFRKGDAQHPLFPSDEEILLDRGLDSSVARYVRVPPNCGLGISICTSRAAITTGSLNISTRGNLRNSDVVSSSTWSPPAHLARKWECLNTNPKSGLANTLGSRRTPFCQPSSTIFVLWRPPQRTPKLY